MDYLEKKQELLVEDKNLLPINRELIEKALNMIGSKSNVEKSIEMAKIIRFEMGYGTTPIVAALLADAVAIKELKINELKNDFGKEVISILDGLERIPKLHLDKYLAQTENFIQLLLTITQDINAILVKLTERLFHLRNLKYETEERQRSVAQEILSLYAPVAHRLGMYAVKTEFEDSSMKFLNPEIYFDIARKLDQTKAFRAKYINEFIAPIQETLEQNNYKFTIKGRPKSIFSIWNKMKKQGVPFNEVYDLFAIRIILDIELKKEKAICWNVYSLLTDSYTPNPKRLRDWISSPKGTGYESLHATVIGNEGKWVEVQIRTERMDEIAEKGHAAHWKYKESGNAESGDWLARMREALENPAQNDDESVEKKNLYSDEIFIFTPNGDLRKMHANATILDFAFSIHSNIGETCTGAIVNGKMQNIKNQLNNGDEVKILTSKKQRPKHEWLEIAKSTKAQNRIKRALKASLYEDSENGKEIVKQKLQQLKMDFVDSNINVLTDYFEFSTPVEMYQAFGKGKIDVLKIKKAFVKEEIDNETVKKDMFIPDTSAEKLLEERPDYLVIDNLSTLDFNLSKCCNPIPGDKIFGFVTVTKGTRIHKKSCPNAKELYARYPYRVVEARWTKEDFDTAFTANIHLAGYDALGVTNAITQIVSTELKLNMRSINIKSRSKNQFDGIIVIDVHGKKELNAVITRLQKIKDVISVTRLNKL